MAEILPGTSAQVFTDAIRQALTEALSKALSSTWNVQVSPDDAPPSSDPGQPLCFSVAPSGGLKGNVAFQLRASDAVFLAHKVMGETPDPAAALNDDRKQAIEKFLRQVAELAAAALKPQIGEVNFEVNNIEPPAWAGVTIVLNASDSASNFSLLLRLGTEMTTLTGTSQAATTSQSPTTVASSHETTQSIPENLDLLLGIDLNLTLRFGERTLTLREILDLSSGSVIELDRRVQEPADLLLGDKLIARGEVVIVDGNYGLRITEVSDPQHTAARGVLNSALR